MWLGGVHINADLWFCTSVGWYIKLWLKGIGWFDVIIVMWLGGVLMLICGIIYFSVLVIQIEV